MAERQFTYVYGGQKTVPSHGFITDHAELFQSIWEKLQAIVLVKMNEDFREVIGELPPSSQRLVSAAIEMFSDEPRNRYVDFRKRYKGRLVPNRVITPRALLASSWVIESENIRPTERERYFNRNFPDPAGLARDFFALVHLRIMKSWPQDPNSHSAIQYGTGARTVRGHGGGYGRGGRR